MSAVAFDAATFSSAGNPPAFNHTCTGSNRYLLLGLTDWAVNPLSSSGTAATYNGVSMSPLDEFTTTPAGFRWFGLIAPASGSHAIAITGAGSSVIAVAMSFTNVHQTTPEGPTFQNNGYSTTATVDVTSTAAESIVACVVSYFGPNTSVTVGAGQSNDTKGASGNSGISMSTEPGNGGTVTMSESWTTVGSDSWSIGSITLLTATPSSVTNHFLSCMGAGS